LTVSTFLDGLPKNVLCRSERDTWLQQLLDLVAQTMTVADNSV
jgi:hypothetical protein